MTRFQKIRKRLLHACVRRMSERRQRILTYRLMEESGVESMTFEREGIIWNSCVRNDSISWQLFVDGSYQRAEMSAVIDWMRARGVLAGSRNVVVDAGANIGTTCITLARQIGCRALAIEPVSDNFHNLQKSVEANGLAHRIALAKKAVARVPGKAIMRLDAGNSGGHFVLRGPHASGPRARGYEEVETDTLAGIVAAAGIHLSEIALVWADVQGCETDIIESGQPLWQRRIPMWAEVEPISLERQGALSEFTRAAARHFDHFIHAGDLMRTGSSARPSPIAELPALIERITPEQLNTDVLLLPPASRR